MKRIVLMIGLAMAASAWGQGQKPAAEKPAAKAPAAPEAAKPVAQEVAKEPAKPAGSMAKKSRRSEDARHCLDQSSNTAIIKCAEEYL